jgi:hypothetical protein
MSGNTDVLEIVGVTHWAVQVIPGQARFPSDSPHFVDTTIVCRRSSISEQKEKEKES